MTLWGGLVVVVVIVVVFDGRGDERVVGFIGSRRSEWIGILDLIVV